MSNQADTAYEGILARIMSGELPPGAQVKEQWLADEMNVSRTPVREALRRLSAEGMLDLREKRSSVVRALDINDLSVMYDLREMAEAYIARAAAATVTDEQISELAELADRMDAAERKVRIDEIGGLNHEFHRLIRESSGSTRLVTIGEMLLQVPLQRQMIRNIDRPSLRRNLGHHHEIIDAFRAHDGRWAESIMSAHVLSTKASMIEFFEGSDPFQESGEVTA